MPDNRLTAYRAIVDGDGRPLPEFILMWDGLADDADGELAMMAFQQAQQEANTGALYAAGLAQASADALDAAGGGTVRSGISLAYVNTTGATWVNAVSEGLSGVSAGDLTIINSGPVMAIGADDETTGEYRIVEQPGATTVFSGTWRATGDGDTFSVVYNESLLSTLTFSSSLASTGSITYELDVRVTSGIDIQLLTYLFVRRS